jgi:hypothetical protein
LLVLLLCQLQQQTCRLHWLQQQQQRGRPFMCLLGLQQQSWPICHHQLVHQQAW